MRDSKIQWTDHTFNPWRGCAKVSPGCANCYAETLSRRNPAVLGVWGQHGTRVVASKSMWREPLKWNREAELLGLRQRVFCASLADVFEDRPELDEPRARLFDLILQTPWLDWLLLTKRPEVMRDYLVGREGDLLGGSRLPHAWGDGWCNVWLGVSVEDQQRARERIPVLLSIPAKVHWLSCEPLLYEVDLRDWLHKHQTYTHQPWPHGPVDWVIVGGESGPESRVFQRGWADRIVRDCRDAGRTVFVKQLGANYADEANGVCGHSTRWPLDVLPAGPTQRLSDPKGGDMEEWPESLRVREVPE